MRLRILLHAWLSCIAAAGVAHAANVGDFLDYSLKSGATTVLPGRLYVPPEAISNPATMRPLILFLHGAGEAGTNNTAQVNVNIDNLLAEAKRRGAFLYAPQSPGDWAPTSRSTNVMTMVDRSLTDFPVDRSRVYITGLSNGGGGTWNMLSRFPNRFAAAVPICGVAPASDFNPLNLVNEPIAAFHARNDTTVAVGTSRSTYNRVLLAAGESLPTYPATTNTLDFVHQAATHDLNYVEFATGGHGIWPAVYGEPQLYQWLFSHALVPEPGAATMGVLGVVALTSRRRLISRRR